MSTVGHLTAVVSLLLPTLKSEWNMTYTIETLAKEQEALKIDTFDYNFVWSLGAAMRENAAAKQVPVILTIAHGTNIVFSLHLPGATADNIDWAARKRAVAWRFQRSSLAMRPEAENGQFDFNKMFRLPEASFVAGGGGVPLILKSGMIIGTVGVSGLPDVEDHKIIVECLQSLHRK